MTVDEINYVKALKENNEVQSELIKVQKDLIESLNEQIAMLKLSIKIATNLRS